MKPSGKRFAISAALCIGALGCAGLAVAQAPRVNRAAFGRLENRLDIFLVKDPDPCQLLGNTRGIYLDGYGAVFTAMVALVTTPIPNPFHEFTQADVDKVYTRKVRQVPIVKQKMQDMLLMMASDPALEGVRPHEQIVCGLTFFYYKQWENTSGLPLQYIMQAEKQKLLDVQAGRAKRSEMEAFAKFQEF